MIPARGAKELDILKHPRTLLAMPPAEQSAALDALAAIEFGTADSYNKVYHGTATDYALEPTMLAQQIRALRLMFAEWPTLLVEIVVLLLEARTGIPSKKWRSDWGRVAGHHALLGAASGLMRVTHLPDLGREQQSAFVSHDQHDRKNLPAPARPEVWDAAARVKRGCTWMLADRRSPEIRDHLESIVSSLIYTADGLLITAAIWALAQPCDRDAIGHLSRLMIDSRCSSRRDVLRGYVDSIEQALGDRPAPDSPEVRFAYAMANSGYAIAESMVRALSVLDVRPDDQRALRRLLIDATGPRPSKEWLARWKALRGDSLDPVMEEALVGIVSSYNEITSVRPLISNAEFEASAYFDKTGDEQPGNPAARGMAKRAVELDRVYGTGIPNIKELDVYVKNAARGANRALAGENSPFLCELWAQTVVAWARIGASNPVVAYAAISALSQAGGDDSVRHLQALRARIKHKNLAKRIEAAFAIAAKAQGLSPDELADRLVPDHGLDATASREWAAGEFRIRLSLDADGQVRAHILDAAGTVVKKIPTEIARAHAGVLAEFRVERKALAATVSLQRSRLESAMVAGRRWTFDSWHRAFAQHPILIQLARRLLWRIESNSQTAAIGIPTSENAWASIDRSPFDVSANSELSLIHPIGLTPEDQSAWQRRIIVLEIVQPFKQLFRETYFPTTTERDESEITRYRGHLVPLALLRALTVSRGWVGGLGLTGFDGSGQGSRRFESFGIEALLYHDGNMESDEARIETAEFRRISTTPAGRIEPQIRLGDVPPLVFSEVLRDIDLVASVGSVGVGELGIRSAESQLLASAFGLTRSPTIAALIPSVGLAGRVSFDGGYAVIDGRFTVHLGTAAVTRYPSGEPETVSISRRIARDVRLPFEDKDDAITILINVILTLAGHDE